MVFSVIEFEKIWSEQIGAAGRELERGERREEMKERQKEIETKRKKEKKDTCREKILKKSQIYTIYENMKDEEKIFSYIDREREREREK